MAGLWHGRLKPLDQAVNAGPPRHLQSRLHRFDSGGRLRLWRARFCLLEQVARPVQAASSSGWFRPDPAVKVAQGGAEGGTDWTQRRYPRYSLRVRRTVGRCRSHTGGVPTAPDLLRLGTRRKLARRTGDLRLLRAFDAGRGVGGGGAAQHLPEGCLNEVRLSPRR
jgi:hypothetical protein